MMVTKKYISILLTIALVIYLTALYATGMVSNYVTEAINKPWIDKLPNIIIILIPISVIYNYILAYSAVKYSGFIGTVITVAIINHTLMIGVYAFASKLFDSYLTIEFKEIALNAIVGILTIIIASIIGLIKFRLDYYNDDNIETLDYIQRDLSRTHKIKQKQINRANRQYKKERYIECDLCGTPNPSTNLACDRCKQRLR